MAAGGKFPADWDKEELETFAHKGPGEYEIHGKLRKKHYPVPFTERTGDPFIICYHGRYLMTWSGGREVTIRAADTLEGLHEADAKVIYPDTGRSAGSRKYVGSGIPRDTRSIVSVYDNRKTGPVVHGSILYP